tara:strand:+ start:320 stop:673 length:354 start_codon:yes stop_codon:yes gene_type:complete
MTPPDWHQKSVSGNLVGEPVQIGLPKAQCFGSGARLTPAMQYASCHWGRLAQLVERFVYTEDVGGSSPSSPTIFSAGYSENGGSGNRYICTDITNQGLWPVPACSWGSSGHSAFPRS